VVEFIDYYIGQNDFYVRIEGWLTFPRNLRNRTLNGKSVSRLHLVDVLAHETTLITLDDKLEFAGLVTGAGRSVGANDRLALSILELFRTLEDDTWGNGKEWSIAVWKLESDPALNTSIAWRVYS
jgi:hypothetical protein